MTKKVMDGNCSFLAFTENSYNLFLTNLPNYFECLNSKRIEIVPKVDEANLSFVELTANVSAIRLLLLVVRRLIMGKYLFSKIETCKSFVSLAVARFDGMSEQMYLWCLGAFCVMVKWSYISCLWFKLHPIS